MATSTLLTVCAILISFLSLLFAVYSGNRNGKRTDRKDAEEEATRDAAVMVKLENLQTTLIEMKAEMKSDREDVKRMTEKFIRNEESLKSLHKRVDRIEGLLKLTGRPE